MNKKEEYKCRYDRGPWILGKNPRPEQISFNRFDFVDCGKDGTIIWNPDLKMYLSEDNYIFTFWAYAIGKLILGGVTSLTDVECKAIEEKYGEQSAPKSMCVHNLLKQLEIEKITHETGEGYDEISDLCDDCNRGPKIYKSHINFV